MLVIMSISSDNNHYTTSASNLVTIPIIAMVT